MGLAARKLRATNAAAGAGGFSPDDIAGLVAWYDAADSATITATSGDVSQWDDKSASGLDVVQAGSNQPRTGDATQNGRNVLSFASGDLLRVTPVTKICGSALSIFVVFRKTGTANTYEAPPLTLTASNVARPFDAWNDKRFNSSGTTISGTYTNLSTQTAWAQMTFTNAASGTFRERKDGAAVSSGATGAFNTTSQALTIASRGDGVTKLTSDIAEIVVYDVELTGTDLTDVEGYLATKWGTP